MPATAAALAKLQQRFTTPSIQEIQKYSPCAICWADYDEGIMSDTPVKLPCRHVFGEKCLLKWAQGRTPSGYRNGRPLCHADLLPQSLWTRTWTSVLSKITEDGIFFETHPPPAAQELCGGRMGQTVFMTTCVILIGSFMTSDELLGASTAHMLALFMMAFTSYRGVRFYGLLFGLSFGLLWGVMQLIAFRMICFIPLLTIRILEIPVREGVPF